MKFDYKRAVINFWQDLNHKDWERVESYFHKNALITWPNTIETFTPHEYVTVNRIYPGEWDLNLKDVQMTEQNIVAVVKITAKNAPISLDLIAFFRFDDGLITSLTEYFAEDGLIPAWRKTWRDGQK